MIFTSPFPPLDIPSTNVLSYLFPDGQEPSDEPTWIDSEDPSHHLTPRQLLGWVRRLAFGLERLGLQRGDVVLLCTPNHIFVPVAYLGIVGAGCIFSGANPAYTVSGRFPRSSALLLAFF
jgi:acyl-CoA synthetase (AMP-forming)/AMP-acid ligase II